MEILADTTSIALVNAAVEKIDLTEWLFTLKDHEYQACSKAHIAGGRSLSKDGKRISINVEQVADNLLVQHYEEDHSERNHCRVNSISDSLSPMGRTKLGIIWELKVTKISETTCELSNRVIVTSTKEFSALLQNAGIINLDPVKDQMHENASAHNKEETPLFAKDIEGKALAGLWA